MNNTLLDISGKIDEDSAAALAHVKAAAIRLLGRDMAKISSQSSGLQISEILAEETNETSKMRLALDIAQETHQIGRDPQEILMLVAKLRQGFEEILLSAGPKGH
jgi:predicted nucleotidyltransferase